MVSIVYRKGILERAYNLVKHDADRRKKMIVTQSDINTSIYDQLTAEHNGYDFHWTETANIINALEENGYITYVSCADGEDYYTIN